MTDTETLNTEPQRQFLEQIKNARCVMLGSPDASQQLQPMSPQVDSAMIEDAENGQDAVVYFYSDNTSELGRTVLERPGDHVRLVFMDKDYQVSATGALDVERSPDLVERFWNPIAASWYPSGQDDPKMLMLKFTLDQAQVWASDANFVTFLYETAKANLTDTLPDVGARAEIG
ncbi:pyridoxamine 5'-phosphate oxidase family protein [uncultured Algimonas sp.]|uniref:pyridoxamine 5'-phosphate oxidase family protein n=1 Tax=uncultured Algimonas sp. TaxID=1547920 RepID=UPI00260316E4|nr:pyridoxamine 5'-phosphate oxidase family protein [uncultured Algimonas sp.]